MTTSTTTQIPDETPPEAGTPERIVQLYGDMLFDLCESVLWSPVTAQIAFRSILKTLKRRRKGHGYTEHERAYVLQVACEKLLELAAIMAASSPPPSRSSSTPRKTSPCGSSNSMPTFTV